MDAKTTFKQKPSSTGDKQKRSNKKRKKPKRTTQEPFNNGEQHGQLHSNGTNKPDLEVFGEGNGPPKISIEECAYVIGGSESDNSSTRRTQQKHNNGANSNTNTPRSQKNTKGKTTKALNDFSTKKTLKQSFKNIVNSTSAISSCSTASVYISKSASSVLHTDLTTMQQDPLYTKVLPSSFNESLRWEYELDDRRAEEDRLDHYKLNRRKRYLAHAQSKGYQLSCPVPSSCTPGLNMSRSHSVERTVEKKELIHTSFSSPRTVLSNQQLLFV